MLFKEKMWTCLFFDVSGDVRVRVNTLACKTVVWLLL